MMVHPASLKVSRAPSYSGYHPGSPKDFDYGAVTLFGRPFQSRLSILDRPDTVVLQPQPAHRLVWALPVSLAATQGISIDFFSYGYLDVSVPRVRSDGLWIQPAVTGYDPCRVAPFGNPRIKGCLHLPEAYRSLPRPSSLPRAKASALRPFLLDFYFPRSAKKPVNYSV